jgi:hypothetical protein
VFLSKIKSLNDELQRLENVRYEQELRIEQKTVLLEKLSQDKLSLEEDLRVSRITFIQSPFFILFPKSTFWTR